MARKSVASGSISVDGLYELSKALKEMGPEARKELTRENREVAKGVADKARSAALSVGGVAAHAAPSVKAAAGADWAGVALGSAAHPEAAGAEFGGGARPSTQQFQPWRGAGSDAGYFLYPTIRAESSNIQESYENAINDVIQRVGLA